MRERYIYIHTHTTCIGIFENYAKELMLYTIGEYDNQVKRMVLK